MNKTITIFVGAILLVGIIVIVGFLKNDFNESFISLSGTGKTQYALNTTTADGFLAFR